MLSTREVGVVAQRELLRNIRSGKGIAMFSLFLLGGLVFSMLVSNVIGMLLKKIAAQTEMSSLPPELQRQLFESYLGEMYGSEAVAKHLGGSPAILYFLFKGTLVFLPLLVLLVGFDQLAGEIQHRTIRYSAGRASRASIVVGKALGIWGVVSVMVLVLHVTVWVIVLARGESIVPILSWGGRFWLYSCLCAASYVGFSSIVSSLFRTPIVALFVGAGIGAVLWLAHGLLGLSHKTEAATWAFPNAYEQLLVLPEAQKVLGGALLFILWGALCVAGSTFIMTRRDV
jgi:ABC-type transport system involved in multi-copper enzyme maturation permease subunit